jgi:hypothetical protein
VITNLYHTAVCAYKATYPPRYKDYGIQRTTQHITNFILSEVLYLPSCNPSQSRDVICFLIMRATRWNIKHPILKNEHLINLKHPQSSMKPLNRREPDDYRSSINTRSARRSAIIKVKLLFSGSTSPRMEKEHLAKLAPASQLRFFICHNLATS